jgi:RND family efflux transporter MFP subunit
MLIILLVLVALVAAGGIVMRLHEGSALNRATKEEAVPTVVVMKAAQGPPAEDITLPGTVQAWHEAPIYARTNGYLKDWVTDIGTPVKAGDLIAEIEAPEIDAQLKQAEADLATAQANNRIAQITATRWENLLKTNAVSKQDADSRVAAAAAAAATEASADANVNHLRDLVSFERIVAPFDGIITARNTDDGALINAGSSGTGPELFHIAETDKLRVYVQVPETYVDAIKPDLVADLHFAEHPGEVFSARLTRTADALDPTARTLLIELEVDNEKGELMPGGYTDVHFKLPSSPNAVRLPVNTLLFRADGLQVATIDADGNALLKSIKVSRDFGKEVEVQSGIAPGETIIVNPPDSLATGQPVRVITSGDDQDGDGKDGDGGTKDGKDNDKNDDGGASDSGKDGKNQ